MENTTRKREIDFRQQPPTKAPAPTQFKVRPKSRPKKTLFVALGVIALTCVVFFAVPSPQPEVIQKGIGAVYAAAVAFLVMTAVREFWKKIPAPTAGDAAKAATAKLNDSNSNNEKSNAAREQKDHLLHQVGGHHRYARGRKRWSWILGILTFAGVGAIWFTSYAPIEPQVIELDLDQALADSATTTLLVLTDPEFPLIRLPLPSLASRISAETRLSKDPYRAGNQLIARGDYPEARGMLEPLRKEAGLDAAQKTKIDVAIAQSYLFEGRPADALKILKPMEKKEPNVLAHAASAALLAGQYRDAREWAAQLQTQAKSGSPDDKARALNYLLALNVMNWRKTNA
ncbi:MAG: hypothetical protein QM811_06255 [Pirellulales bacterium]